MHIILHVCHLKILNKILLKEIFFFFHCIYYNNKYESYLFTNVSKCKFKNISNLCNTIINTVFVLLFFVWISNLKLHISEKILLRWKTFLSIMGNKDSKPEKSIKKSQLKPVQVNTPPPPPPLKLDNNNKSPFLPVVT